MLNQKVDVNVDKERYHCFDCQASNQLQLLASEIQVTLELRQLALACIAVTIWLQVYYSSCLVNEHQNYDHEEQKFEFQHRCSIT